jgi:hypothetical protein
MCRSDLLLPIMEMSPELFEIITVPLIEELPISNGECSSGLTPQ